MYTVDQLHEGDILLMLQSHAWDTPSGMLDELIKWATVNPFDHAAVVIRDSHGALVIAEALLHVTISPLDKYTANGWVFSVPSATSQQKQALSLAVQSKVGQFYGWEMLVESATRVIGHIDWTPPINPRTLDCSALVTWGYQQAGLLLSYAPAPAPSDLSYSPLLHGPRPWTPHSA